MSVIIGQYWKGPAQAEIEVTSCGIALDTGIGEISLEVLQGRRPYDPPNKQVGNDSRKHFFWNVRHVESRRRRFA